MSRKELAEKVGVSEFSIKNWEDDLNSCKVSNLLSISKVFNVTPDYLIGLTETRGAFNEDAIS